MHLIRADLDFKRHIVLAEYRRMERLIHIGLRHGDIVLKPPRNRAPHGMNDAENRIAVFYGIHQHADRGEIENLVQLFVLVVHLTVDAVKMLRTALHLIVNVQCIQSFGQLPDDFIYILFALLFSLVDLLCQFFVKIRMKLLQSDILQFEFYGKHTQSVCEGRVNFQGFF